MKVPFLDLKAQYENLREPIDRALHDVLAQTAFAGGPFVAAFEEAFAAFCRTRYAVGVGNGTDALWLTLLALGVGRDDEVITVPNTFIATAEAITFCGAKPVFVDVDPATCTMDPGHLPAAITPRTRAIIPVHLFGQPANMDPIVEIAAARGIAVIEDACQAHGAEYRGRMAGSLARAGCFSFYPGKNLSAYGEAGAVVTDDAAIADKVRMMRDHGQSKRYYHQVPGWNARMDGFQGAILSVKLPHLSGWNERRRAHAAAYRRLLSGVPGCSLPTEAAYAKHIYHIYAAHVPHRDRVLSRLSEKGISCGIHYPVPVHLQQAYADLRLPPGSYPEAERCAAQVLSLPMYPELTSGQLQYVADELKAALADLTAG
jgi:dTDP-4-amino-4,6-dideoxygalactose transaminase